MSEKHWYDEFPAAITVCDPDGIILEMNQRSAQTFAKDGGSELIGQNVYDCHPEPSRTKLRELMEAQQTNAYTIQKNGVKKLIYQAPWYKDGEFAGFVELSLVIPEEMPHFNRDKK
ncbi:MAG TPA: PAS domain-containing protein [Anaerolineaceae bacterium]|nr:PAS domain-containing protein [Anaerolineaceae bacterium]HPN53582.1 PAS domain-containing protein [Anaerolineaceae bacterium]